MLHSFCIESLLHSHQFLLVLKDLRVELVHQCLRQVIPIHRLIDDKT